MFTNSDSETPAELGKRGEHIAQRYVSCTLGWRVVDTNVRSKYGEIDIVAVDRAFYIFIEVKSRRTRRYGSPLESVTPLKLARLKQQVDIYLQMRHISQDRISVRLDVIGLDFFNGLVHLIQHVTIE